MFPIAHEAGLAPALPLYSWKNLLSRIEPPRRSATKLPRPAWCLWTPAAFGSVKRALSRWEALTRYAGDGRLAIYNNGYHP